jgi:hypothetical protein
VAFADGLLELFVSPTPPTKENFQLFSYFTDDIWAIYVLILERKGRKSRLYAGSETCKKHSVLQHMSSYDKEQAGPDMAASR